MTAFGIDPATEAVVIALHTALYLGALLFAGTAIFDIAIGRELTPSGQRVRRVAGVLAAVASVAFGPFTAMWSLGLAPSAVLQPQLWTPLVRWPSVALGFVTCVGVAAVFVLTPPGGRGRRPALLAAGVVAAAPVLVGHSAVLDPPSLRVLDAVHLVAASIWIGGLVGMLLLLTARSTTAGGDRDPHRTALVLERFSRWALASVTVVAITGTAVAIAQVGDVATLVGTRYGQTLLVKLVVVAATVGVAAWNRFALVPAIRRHTSDAAAWSSLRRTIICELALLLVAVAVTGVLTNTAGAHAGH